eukprot:TRINITY_DN1160_c0_g3_i1.p1 TRINITY_DN1160_c0_g3~~TRINITY_DN1160_c0_g3_i1.p1  ORF type:complete len:374 (+),score=102.36 TRINITY_DN1160_c0_g3_i1:306-1427(+)
MCGAPPAGRAPAAPRRRAAQGVWRRRAAILLALHLRARARARGGKAPRFVQPCQTADARGHALSPHLSNNASAMSAAHAGRRRRRHRHRRSRGAAAAAACAAPLLACLLTALCAAPLMLRVSRAPPRLSAFPRASLRARSPPARNVSWRNAWSHPDALSSLRSLPALRQAQPACNCSRVAEALYKIVKLFGVRTLCDTPAAAHAHWMRHVVTRLSFDTPHFRYIAIERNRSALQRLTASYRNVVDMDGAPHWRAQRCELLLHWPRCDGDAMPPTALSLLRQARAGGCALVLFAQTAATAGAQPHTLAFRAGRWTLLHTNGAAVAAAAPSRREPFALNEFVKGAIAVGAGARHDALYLTLYSLRAMPPHVFAYH